MEAERNNKSIMKVRRIKKNNWKKESADYLGELEHFLDVVTNVKEEGLRRDILMTMLRADNELTISAEKLFEQYYAKGYEDGKKDNSRSICRDS